MNNTKIPVSSTVAAEAKRLFNLLAPEDQQECIKRLRKTIRDKEDRHAK